MGRVFSLRKSLGQSHNLCAHQYYAQPPDSCNVRGKYRITSYLFDSHPPATRPLWADRIEQQTSIQSALCHVRGRGSDDCELWHGDHRQDTITLDPGPVTDNSLATHSVQQLRGKATHINKTLTQHNKLCSLCQFLHPLSGTDKSWSETPYFMLFQFSPGVVQLLAGSATATVTTYPELPPLSSSHFVARSGSLVFLAASTHAERWQGYQQTCTLPPLHVHPYTLHWTVFIVGQSYLWPNGLSATVFADASFFWLHLCTEFKITTHRPY